MIDNTLARKWDNIVLLFPVNNAMIRVITFSHVISLFAKNSKLVISRYNQVFLHAIG